MLNPASAYVCRLGYQEFLFLYLISLYIISILTNYSWGGRISRIAGTGVHHSEDNLNSLGGKGFSFLGSLFHIYMIPDKDDSFILSSIKCIDIFIWQWIQEK